MSIRSTALSFVAVFCFAACTAGGASAGTMTAYPAEDYPSVHAAIDGLVGPAGDVVLSHDGADVQRFAVTGPARPEHLRRAGEAVAKRLPGRRYTLAEASASDGAVTLEVDVKELGRSPVAWQTGPAAHGTVSLTVIADGERQSFSARFQEKPWADDFAAFTNANPGRPWAVGRAGRPWGSQAEASADALASAAEALVPVVRGRLKESRRESAFDEGRLRQVILEDLQTGRLVADRFSQRFARPYGDVWSEAVLVDAAPDKLKAIAERYGREARGRDARKARTFGIGGGLLIVLSLLYLSLNAFTKGYFTWRLRAVTLLLGVVGMLVLVRIA
jgi:hypothetical protein